MQGLSACSHLQFSPFIGSVRTHADHSPFTKSLVHLTQFFSPVVQSHLARHPDDLDDATKGPKALGVVARLKTATISEHLIPVTCFQVN